MLNLLLFTTLAFCLFCAAVIIHNGCIYALTHNCKVPVSYCLPFGSIPYSPYMACLPTDALQTKGNVAIMEIISGIIFAWLLLAFICLVFFVAFFGFNQTKALLKRLCQKEEKPPRSPAFVVEPVYSDSDDDDDYQPYPYPYAAPPLAYASPASIVPQAVEQTEVYVYSAPAQAKAMTTRNQTHKRVQRRK